MCVCVCVCIIFIYRRSAPRSHSRDTSGGLVKGSTAQGCSGWGGWGGGGGDTSTSYVYYRVGAQGAVTSAQRSAPAGTRNKPYVAYGVVEEEDAPPPAPAPEYETAHVQTMAVYIIVDIIYIYIIYEIYNV